MHLPVILAHGALGVWDEVIFLSVAAIFLIMMGISWIRSRSAPLDETENHELPPDAYEKDRFRLD
jgi:hypothetical protein